VDPGRAGAFAFWDPGTGTLLTHDMPTLRVRRGKTVRTIVDEHSIVRLLRAYRITHAYVESPHAMPKQGIASAFMFGVSLGILRGIFAALEIPFTMLDPAGWMKQAGITHDPDGARRRAMQIFPRHSHLFSRRKDDGRADAALLAYLLSQV